MYVFVFAGAPSRVNNVILFNKKVFTRLASRRFILLRQQIPFMPNFEQITELLAGVTKPR